jgi:hypothetical protein
MLIECLFRICFIIWLAKSTEAVRERWEQTMCTVHRAQRMGAVCLYGRERIDPHQVNTGTAFQWSARLRNQVEGPLVMA